MSHYLPYTIMAAAYNCGAYGQGAYDEASCAASTQTSAQPGLVNTGYNVILPVALGLAIIIAVVILFFKQHRRKRSIAQ